MKAETSRSSQGFAATTRMSANFDEMTVAEFFDYVQWWAKLTSTDRQTLLTPKNQPRH
jgi:hypothetical protein